MISIEDVHQLVLHAEPGSAAGHADEHLPSGGVLSVIAMPAAPLPTLRRQPGRGPLVSGRSHARVLTMPRVPRAVSQARLWVRETLTRWSLAETVAPAQQVTSELLNNAIKHTDAGPSVTLLLMYAAGTLRIEARDHDPRHLPVMRNPGPLDEEGRGLLIVSAFSQRWGFRVTEAGKCVWSELDVVRNPVAHHSAWRGSVRGDRP